MITAASCLVYPDTPTVLTPFLKDPFAVEMLGATVRRPTLLSFIHSSSFSRFFLFHYLLLTNFIEIRKVPPYHCTFDYSLCFYMYYKVDTTHQQHTYLVITFLSDHLHGYMFRPLISNFQTIKIHRSKITFAT
jgi:hypothetical protein